MASRVDQRIDEIEERRRVEDVAVRLFVATDRREWAALEGVLTDPVTLDMTSMTGGQPLVLKPAEVSAAWEAGFASLDHVHHQVGNFQTTIGDDLARVQCYGIAFHHRSKIEATIKSRTFVGTYEIEMVPHDSTWRIRLLRFNLKFIEGNLDLEKAR